MLTRNKAAKVLTLGSLLVVLMSTAAGLFSLALGGQHLVHSAPRLECGYTETLDDPRQR